MHTVSVISVHFISKYQNEAEQQTSFLCGMQRHPMSKGHIPIAVNRQCNQIYAIKSNMQLQNQKSLIKMQLRTTITLTKPFKLMLTQTV